MSGGLIEYILYTGAEKPVQFRINLDYPGNKEKTEPDEPLPDWALLQRNQCEHCPLTLESSKYCPLATRIIPFTDRLSHLSSIERVKVTVIQGDRESFFTAQAQDVLSSLLGLYIATSDCPHTSFLRPLAHFHLPLADTEETMYRVLSMYRLAQCIKKNATNRAYANFEELEVHYESLSIVHKNLSKRIREALIEEGSTQDGALNAITLLDALSQYVPMTIEEALKTLEPMFSMYWEHEKI